MLGGTSLSLRRAWKPRNHALRKLRDVPPSAENWTDSEVHPTENSTKHFDSVPMSNGGQRRTRSERVAALELPPGRWERAWLGLCRRDTLLRMVLAFLAAAAVCVIIRAWDPPMHWR